MNTREALGMGVLFVGLVVAAVLFTAAVTGLWPWDAAYWQATRPAGRPYLVRP